VAGPRIPISLGATDEEHLGAAVAGTEHRSDRRTDVFTRRCVRIARGER
jgi:hypothetical protein